MPATSTIRKQRLTRRRKDVDERLDQLVDAGDVTLDERLHIEAAAAAAGVKLGTRPTSPRRPGT